jgi:exodeoxyribonuclease VII large subunit
VSDTDAKNATAASGSSSPQGDTWGSKVSSTESPWPVSKLSATLKDWIDRLGYLWVEGEISQISLRSTNMFGQLRDLQLENSIEIHSWDTSKIPIDLKQGDRVVALLKPNFWPKGGKLTMQVFEIRKVGLGELLERIERLRQALIAEGLTSADRKQPLPFLPNRIGLITGKDSDAEKDVLQNAKRRWPDAQFRVINTLVQGEKAVPEIIAAIRQLDQDPEVDVIVIARGGGSFIDLVIFSDEALVREVAAARTPIVSAIGHENDRPVLDEVADVRASTPTDAAKLIVPDVADERARIDQAIQRILLRIEGFVTHQSQLIAQFRSRPSLANPYSFIDDKAVELDQQIERSRRWLDTKLDRESVAIAHLRAQVRALSPQSTLDRGYAVVRDETGHVISDSSKLKVGQKITMRLARGEVEASVNRSIEK